jgi:hypothetical protein
MGNMETHYFYGAEVQGIQNFIFSTNKLKEIVGASELVEEICTTAFKEFLGNDFKEENALVMAAGKIRYRFDDQKLCEKVARNFPKRIIETAPGITISQAVVKADDGKNYSDCAMELERRLRQQRNRQFCSPTTGLMGILRSRETGLPVTGIISNDYVDISTEKKLLRMPVGEKSTTHRKLNDKLLGNLQGAYDISKIETEDSWIAIVHIDGNGLGQIVQKIGSNDEDSRKFSKYLDMATTAAAANAYKSLKEEQGIAAKDGYEPIRPIVLSGDDFTMICRADIAVDFVRHFLDEFEKCTGKDVNSDKEYTKGLREIIKKYKVFNGGEKNYMSACAGIAYMKSSFPFYYGYNLAEALCSDAKGESKKMSGGMEKLPPSSVSFHRIQSSFIESFSEIVKKELTAGDTSFKFGPYYLDMEYVKQLIGVECKMDGIKRWSIDELKGDAAKISQSHDGKALKNNLREWTNLLGSNPGYAQQRAKRVVSLIANKDLRKLVRDITNAGEEPKYKERNPTYDILVLSSIEKKKLSTEKR